MIQKLKLLGLMMILVVSFSLPSLAVHAENNNENDNAQTENTENEAENSENTNENNNGDNDNNSDANEEKENTDKNSNENEKPDNNNEDNKKNEENEGNENNGNDNDASNNSDDPNSVSAGEKIPIGEFGSYIIMPDDLPEGSTLTATDASNSPAAQNALQSQGIVPSGDVFAFDLDTNGNNDYSGSFKLALAIGDNASGGAEMYYYNEGAQEWEKQSGASKNDTGNERVITATLSHLSMYGVFGIDINADPNLNEDCDASDINIRFDEETEVCADQRVHIDESENYVTMPSDLPPGTTLRVSDINEADIVTEANGLIRCGEAMEFDVNTPEGESFEGNFDLKMSYCNGFSADDIYSYENGDWEAQGGEFDYDDFTLNLQTATLGSLVVFALDDEDDETAARKKNDRNSKDGKKAPKEEANTNNNEDDKANVAVNDNNDDKDDGFLLPSTATNMFAWIAIGSVLALGGIILLIIRKIRNRTI